MIKEFMFYFLVPLILLSIFLIIRLIIIKYFDSQKQKLSSNIYPLIIGITFLFAGFLTLTSFWNQILDILIFNLNFYFKVEVEKDFSTNLYTTINYSIFSISIVIVLITHLLTYRKNRKEKEVELEKNKDDKIYSIDLPPEPPVISKIFHERTKEIFELKYPKLKLTFDRKYKLLYGKYKEGLHVYIKIIYCHDSVTPVFVEKNNADEILLNIFKVLKTNGIIDNSNLIVDSYYILELGQFSERSKVSYFLTEDEIPFHLINFEEYLKTLIYNFENDPLPFSTKSINGKKITLKETFIEPKYNENKVDLYAYMQDWLTEDSNKQIALLGDSGTGKTSFLKYLSSRLAKEVLEGKSTRIPILLKLASTSPIHQGIDGAISKFILSNRLEVNIDLFYRLIHNGNLVFMLDGFDEMGFIGSHDQRFEQLNAIWQLAMKKNKLIIAGRPSYFPSEFEEKSVLNIVNDKDLEFPKQRPFCKKVMLNYFDEKSILISIKCYYPNEKDWEKYFNFIKSNESVKDLCGRPSMMHIVREMLPYLYKEYQDKSLDAIQLMDTYANYFLERQLQKPIISAITENKKNLILNFFRELAIEYFQNRIQLNANEILVFLNSKIKKLDSFGKQLKEGFENEILTGYFLQRSGDEFQFVHKSFYEYFVSIEIINKLKNKDFNNNLVQTSDWTDGMQYFIYEGAKSEFSDQREIPSLVALSSSNRMAILKVFLFKFIAGFQYSMFQVLFKTSRLSRPIYNFLLNLNTKVLFFSFVAFIICIILIPVLFIDSSYFTDVICTIILSSMLVYTVMFDEYMYWQKKLQEKIKYETALNSLRFVIAIELLVILSLTLGFFIKNLLWGLLLILVNIGTIIILAIILNIIDQSNFFNFTAKAYNFSINNNELQLSSNNYKIFQYIDSSLQKYFHKINGFKIYTSLFYPVFYELDCTDLDIKSEYIGFCKSNLENIKISGNITEIIFYDCKIQMVDFTLAIFKKKNYMIIFENMEIEKIDSFSLNSLVNSLKKSKITDIKNLIGSKTIRDEVEKLLK